MYRAKLLDSRPMPLTTVDITVAADVFLHRLEPCTLEALRRAAEQGLTPSGLNFTGDDDSVAISGSPGAVPGKSGLWSSLSSIPKTTKSSATSTTPSPNSGTPRNSATLTSTEASGPRSPASFANWRPRSLATRASDNRHRSANRRIPPPEAQEHLDGGACHEGPSFAQNQPVRSCESINAVTDSDVVSEIFDNNTEALFRGVSLPVVRIAARGSSTRHPSFEIPRRRAVEV